VPYIST
jgi:hypothetical protein